MIIATYTGGVGRYGSFNLSARFVAGGTGSLQERRNVLTDFNASPIGLLSLESESSIESVLEPIKNHTQQLSCVKGCKQDHFLPSTLFHTYNVNSSQQPSAFPPREELGYWTPYNKVYFNMTQETFKNPATSMLGNSLKGEIITTVDDNGPLTVSGIAKNIGKSYNVIQPVVQDLTEEGKLEISGHRESQFNRTRPEYEVKK